MADDEQQDGNGSTAAEGYGDGEIDDPVDQDRRRGAPDPSGSDPG